MHRVINGLRLDDLPLMTAKRLSAPPGFVVPAWMDSRPYCLPADDQGDTSECAGRAVGGFIEVHDWIRTNIPKQVNGTEIYDGAKSLDGDSGDGTTLYSACKAAKMQRKVPINTPIERCDTPEDVEFAMHRYRVVIGGFAITTEFNGTDKRGFINQDAMAVTRGGHAMLICWRHRANREWGVQNSWGEWGINGFARMTDEQFNRMFRYGCVLAVGTV